MAIVLDINLLSKNFIDFSKIKNWFDEYGITLDSLSSIDSWKWDNEHRINDLNNITEIIYQNKIVIVKLKSSLIKDLGMYIEKMKNNYIYNFWINIEGYPELDYDLINEENRVFYERICQVILQLESSEPKLIEIVGIGLETDFYYSENIKEIIQNSRNMIVWILNKNFKVDTLIGYKGYKMETIQECDKILLKKIES